MSSNESTERFNPQLLQLRRQHQGYSQSALAELCGVTQGHYSKLENGLLTPTEDLLVRLADTLGCPPSFFCQHERIIGLPVSVHPMFRKRSSIPKRAIEQLQADLSLRMMDLRRLLSAVDLPKQNIPRLDVDAYAGDVEEIARLVRGKWLLPSGPIEDLTACLEEAGCVIVFCDLPGQVDGVTIDAPGLPPCIFLNDAMPADRMRFSLAHEVGHIVMHEVPNPDMENQANQFASALLMPAEDVRSQFGTVTLERLATMKRLWRVSMAALLMRADVLGLLRGGQKQYLWRQMSHKGYRRSEPASTEISREQPRVLNEIIDLHMKRLGYSLPELSSALHISENELQQRFRIKGPRLRIVKS